MKTKTEKTLKSTISTRKPWGRLNEEIKAKIISEISSGLLSERAAGRKYGLPKSTVGKWHDKHNLATLLRPQTPDVPLEMDETKESKLLKKKIEELTKALSDAQLKNVALETMIEVAETELKIKIRKKRGTKQS
jgi:transposase